MAKPVRIFIDRVELIGYTSMRLGRNKDDMTGELTIDVFMGWLPDSPVLVEATRGREVLVYIANHLAFSGFIDRRTDKAVDRHPRGANGQFTSRAEAGAGGSGILNVGPSSYSVSFTVRGKTKYVIDSSHQHPTGTMLRPTNRTAIEELLAPWNLPVEWEAEEIQLDKVRLRDGGRVVDEVFRIAEMCSLYVHETRDGKVRVTDTTETATTGEPLVLGANILSFSADQADDPLRSQIIVKGQRIEKDQWGIEAVIPTLQTVEDSNIGFVAPIKVQLYGNGTEKLLQRRAQFEASKRNRQAKQITLDVFHVQQTDGQPWDLGVLHYVEIPPAGVFGLFEVIELVYDIQPDKTLKTTLTLSPVPADVVAAALGSGLMADVPDVNDSLSLAAARRNLVGGGGVDVWGSSVLSVVENAFTGIVTAARELLQDVVDVQSNPPLELPAGYKSEDEE